jgi:sialic acid synthase SpsE
VAEIGKNFIQTAKDQPVKKYLANATALVEAAAKAGVDAVKFQTHAVEDEILNIKFISPHFPNWRSGGRHAWILRNQRATPVKEFWLPLKEFCRKKGIIFFSTPMSRGAAQLLNEQVGVDLWKIGSGDILDFVMLDYMRQTKKPIIISSVMSTLPEMKNAVAFLTEKNPSVALLHCVSKYPCPPQELNLGVIEFLQKELGLPIGFSDHSVGDTSPDLAAVALGAVILEKHFSWSRNLWGPDHKASLTPKEMAKLVRDVRELESSPKKRQEILKSDLVKKSLRVKTKKMRPGEEIFRPMFRKSLMAAQDIKAGTILKPEMIWAMRPQEKAGGLPSEKYPEVLGKKIKKGLKKFKPIIRKLLG